MTKEIKEWHNCGDINFMEYGDCLVREAEFKDCFEVIWLNPEVWDYKGKYKKPMMIARCYVDISSWLDNETLHNVNDYVGNPSNFIPKTLEDKMRYVTDLIAYYGITEFDPDFPEETGCGPYGFTWDKVIVGKTIAQRFMKEHGVPAKFRK